MRNKDIKLFDIFEFITYDNDKLKYVKVVAKKIETISTPLGEYECIIIEPNSKNGIFEDQILDICIYKDIIYLGTADGLVLFSNITNRCGRSSVTF